MQFQLNYNTRVLLPAENVTEIVIISEREILPVPQMPDCVMGIYSWRSEILWIIDLRNLLGFLKTEDGETLNPPSQASLIGEELRKKYQDRKLELERECLHLTAIALKFEGNFLGCYVKQINDILELDTREINLECKELFNKEIAPFLQGYLIDSQQQILMGLKVKTLFDWKA